MTGIIDVHTHILPGIDDGARDWDESRRMLETAYSQGIRHIVASVLRYTNCLPDWPRRPKRSRLILRPVLGRKHITMKGWWKT